MTNADFFWLLAAMFLVRSLPEKAAIWYCWLFLALAFVLRFAK